MQNATGEVMFSFGKKVWFFVGHAVGTRVKSSVCQQHRHLNGCCHAELSFRIC